MMATTDSSSNFRHYKIPMLATPTPDHQLFSAFPASPGHRKKGAGNQRNSFRETPLLEYLSSRPESQRQSRAVKETSLSFQVPLQHIASPHHEHGNTGLPFLSTTRVKSVPLPVLYIKQQHMLNKGIKNVPLHTDRFVAVPKRTRLRSDSLLNLHRKKTNKLHEHLITGEHSLEHSRLLKLQSEIIPHRLDHGYYMSGKEMTLKDRYAVPEEDLQRLKKLNFSANTELYYGKGMSQRKAVRPKHKQLVEDNLDSKRDDKSTKPDTHKSGGQDTAGSIDSLSESEAESKSGDDENNAETTLSIPKEPKATTAEPTNDQQVSITLTSSGTSRSSKTFMTDLKTIDPSMLDDLTDEDMLEIYRKKFEELDIDGSGSITLDELRVSLFGAASEGDIQFIMSLFDLDNSNSIELEEFIAVASLNDKILGKKRTADEPLQLDLELLSQHLRQYKELFGLFDSDGSGEISVEELMILLSAAMGIEEASNTEFMYGIMRKIDKDENGMIDFHEFLRFIPFFLGIHDKIVSEPLSIHNLHNAKVKVREHLRK